MKDDNIEGLLGGKLEASIKVLGPELENLKEALADALNAGDPAKIQKLMKEIEGLKKEIKSLIQAMKEISAQREQTIKKLENELALSSKSKEATEKLQKEIRKHGDAIKEINNAQKALNPVIQAANKIYVEQTNAVEGLGAGTLMTTRSLKELKEALESTSKATGNLADSTGKSSKALKEEGAAAADSMLDLYARQQAIVSLISTIEGFTGKLKASQDINSRLEVGQARFAASLQSTGKAINVQVQAFEKMRDELDLTREGWGAFQQLLSKGLDLKMGIQQTRELFANLQKVYGQAEGLNLLNEFQAATQGNSGARAKALAGNSNSAQEAILAGGGGRAEMQVAAAVAAAQRGDTKLKSADSMEASKKVAARMDSIDEFTGKIFGSSIQIVDGVAVLGGKVGLIFLGVTQLVSHTAQLKVLMGQQLAASKAAVTTGGGPGGSSVIPGGPTGGGWKSNVGGFFKHGGAAAALYMGGSVLDQAQKNRKEEGDGKGAAGYGVAKGLTNVGGAALTGAAIGSIIPGIGTGVGAVVGGLVGVATNLEDLIKDTKTLVNDPNNSPKGRPQEDPAMFKGMESFMFIRDQLDKEVGQKLYAGDKKPLESMARDIKGMAAQAKVNQFGGSAATRFGAIAEESAGARKGAQDSRFEKELQPLLQEIRNAEAELKKMNASDNALGYENLVTSISAFKASVELLEAKRSENDRKFLQEQSSRMSAIMEAHARSFHDSTVDHRHALENLSKSMQFLGAAGGVNASNRAAQLSGERGELVPQISKLDKTISEQQIALENAEAKAKTNPEYMKLSDERSAEERKKAEFMKQFPNSGGAPSGIDEKIKDLNQQMAAQLGIILNPLKDQLQTSRLAQQSLIAQFGVVSPKDVSATSEGALLQAEQRRLALKGQVGEFGGTGDELKRLVAEAELANELSERQIELQKGTEKEIQERLDALSKITNLDPKIDSLLRQGLNAQMRQRGRERENTKDEQIANAISNIARFAGSAFGGGVQKEAASKAAGLQSELELSKQLGGTPRDRKYLADLVKDEKMKELEDAKVTSAAAIESIRTKGQELLKKMSTQNTELLSAADAATKRGDTGEAARLKGMVGLNQQQYGAFQSKARTSVTDIEASLNKKKLEVLEAQRQADDADLVANKERIDVTARILDTEKQRLLMLGTNYSEIDKLDRKRVENQARLTKLSEEQYKRTAAREGEGSKGAMDAMAEMKKQQSELDKMVVDRNRGFVDQFMGKAFGPGGKGTKMQPLDIGERDLNKKGGAVFDALTKRRLLAGDEGPKTVQERMAARKEGLVRLNKVGGGLPAIAEPTGGFQAPIPVDPSKRGVGGVSISDMQAGAGDRGTERMIASDKGAAGHQNFGKGSRAWAKGVASDVRSQLMAARRGEGGSAVLQKAMEGVGMGKAITKTEAKPSTKINIDPGTVKVVVRIEAPPGMDTATVEKIVAAQMTATGVVKDLGW